MIRYIFMGKEIKHCHFIDEWKLKDMVYHCCVRDDSGYLDYLYPDPLSSQWRYMRVYVDTTNHAVFADTDKIEYKIEVGSQIKIEGKEFKVEKIEINGDGTVTCFTDFIIHEEGNAWDNMREARQKVIDMYNEMNINKPKVEKEEKKKKGFWKNLFN